jgi:hypothetical protein
LLKNSKSASSKILFLLGWTKTYRIQRKYNLEYKIEFKKTNRIKSSDRKGEQLKNKAKSNNFCIIT